MMEEPMGYGTPFSTNTAWMPSRIASRVSETGDSQPSMRWGPVGAGAGSTPFTAIIASIRLEPAGSATTTPVTTSTAAVAGAKTAVAAATVVMAAVASTASGAAGAQLEMTAAGSGTADMKSVRTEASARSATREAKCADARVTAASTCGAKFASASAASGLSAAMAPRLRPPPRPPRPTNHAELEVALVRLPLLRCCPCCCCCWPASAVAGRRSTTELRRSRPPSAARDNGPAASPARHANAAVDILPLTRD
mmetsp:Transcript_24700/g.60750  ORF Transcript_24700/g.60750 Transcript_24700/m.60750 type:complete len:253 (+) Transcript_24700:794-1552(+)